jgi:hypothetical protein
MRLPTVKARSEKRLPAANFLRVCVAVFCLSAAYFFFHWMGFRDGPPMRDFLGPYTGARCLWRGCNPYDTAQVAREFAEAGGLEAEHPAWGWEPLVYPPSTLVAMLPVSLLPYHAARALWYGVSAGVFCWGLLSVVWLAPVRDRPWVVLLAAGMLGSEPVELLWNVGQPAAIAVGLAMLALWCFLEAGLEMRGVACLAVALALKPQLAGMVFLFLVMQPRLRKRALLAGALAVGMLVIGGVWLSVAPASRNWLGDLRAQVQSSVAVGAVNDPSGLNRGAAQFTNLQADLAMWDGSSRRVDWMAYGIGAALLAAWGWLMLRLAEPRRGMFAALAAIACVGLLPVYHREYDLTLLAVSFPALLVLVRERRRWRFPALALTALLLLVSPHMRHGWVRFASGARALAWVPEEGVRTVFFLRPLPWLLLLLSVVYLIAMRGQALKSAKNAE